MTEQTPRSAKGFTTLDQLLEEEGIKDEVTAAAHQRVAVINLLKQFVDAQDVQPYRGWDLDKLKAFKVALQAYIKQAPDIPLSNSPDFLKEKVFLQRFLDGANTPAGGWNITHLGKLAAEVREYLGLPSVEDLNPDIKKMSDAAKNSGLFEHLR